MEQGALVPIIGMMFIGLVLSNLFSWLPEQVGLWWASRTRNGEEVSHD